VVSKQFKNRYGQDCIHLGNKSDAFSDQLSMRLIIISIDKSNDLNNFNDHVKQLSGLDHLDMSVRWSFNLCSCAIFKMCRLGSRTTTAPTTEQSSRSCLPLLYKFKPQDRPLSWRKLRNVPSLPSRPSKSPRPTPASNLTYSLPLLIENLFQKDSAHNLKGSLE
jgi:hypothetical protein